MEKAMAEIETASGPATSPLTGLDMSRIRLCPANAFHKIVGGRYKLHILISPGRRASSGVVVFSQAV